MAKRVRRPGGFKILCAPGAARELLEVVLGALLAAAAVAGVLFLYTRWVAGSA